jgi:hypothetical protein
LDTQARYLEQTMYLLWRQGVDTALWSEIRDAPPARRYVVHFLWGGLYFYSGRPKPAATAFRFPFVTSRLDSRRVRVWGRAPSAGPLTISLRVGPARWLPVARIPVTAKSVFLATLRLRGTVVLRAQVGRSVSLPWTEAAR